MSRSPRTAHGSLPAACLQSARLRLAYERARAPNVATAAKRFLRGQLNAIGRLARLGPATTRQLLQLEIACAEAGLGYPGTAPAYPWQLPDAFAEAAASSMPAHPLIDPQQLAELVATDPAGGGAPSAREALARLLEPDSLPGRWRGIPRLTHDGPLPAGPARVAVCLHLFYPDLWPRLRQALQSIPEPWDLYVTVPAYACTPALQQVARDCPSVRFLPCTNRGRDVLPFLRLLAQGVFDRYDAVCKLHSKRSPHMDSGSAWLDQVLHALLGSPAHVQALLARFRSEPQLGLIGPQALTIHPGTPLHRAKNHLALQTLSARSGITTVASAPFFAGTMFWFRPQAMARVRQMNLDASDFPIEMAQTDGTPAHALERLFWPLVEHSGYVVAQS